ncbi:hypothetical protein QAD02_002357 [Eretmocerus hayati]|uniref:Uncharacterized protein n=1 Tax=Eretmocerus hayati TaxID=131215 RepID=A0ACC2NJM5_9HYME|nr:hypothetical protein QAD02_002357 [Eretmocerus hayati]
MARRCDERKDFPDEVLDAVSHVWNAQRPHDLGDVLKAASFTYGPNLMRDLDDSAIGRMTKLLRSDLYKVRDGCNNGGRRCRSKVHARNQAKDLHYWRDPILGGLKAWD